MSRASLESRKTLIGQNWGRKLFSLDRAEAGGNRWALPNALRGYRKFSLTLIDSGDIVSSVALSPKGLVGSILASGSFTFFFITQQPLIAATWGLEPEKELEQTFLMPVCSSPYDQSRGNAMTVLLTHFQISEEAFHGGDIVIHPK